jgi:hypothetical protein
MDGVEEESGRVCDSALSLTCTSNGRTIEKECESWPELCSRYVVTPAVHVGLV